MTGFLFKIFQIPIIGTTTIKQASPPIATNLKIDIFPIFNQFINHQKATQQSTYKKKTALRTPQTRSLSNLNKTRPTYPNEILSTTSCFCL
tara:strand:- start:324 stop:596 length:273 start_codon:yes stop_codon:yes gene_type:complete